MYERFASMVRRGEPLPPSVSMLKLIATETFQEIADLVIDAAGEAGQLAGSVDLGAGNADVLAPFYRARPSTIYGGSSEVQRNILAKSVLRLPS